MEILKYNNHKMVKFSLACALKMNKVSVCVNYEITFYSGFLFGTIWFLLDKKVLEHQEKESVMSLVFHWCDLMCRLRHLILTYADIKKWITCYSKETENQFYLKWEEWSQTWSWTENIKQTLNIFSLEKRKDIWLTCCLTFFLCSTVNPSW